MKKITFAAIVIFVMLAMFAVGVFAANEKELNNTSKTANAIQVNAEVTGNISTS